MAEINIPKEHRLEYDCFAIEEVPLNDEGKNVELHVRTEGGRLIITNKKDAIVLPKKDGQKLDRIAVHRLKAEIQ